VSKHLEHNTPLPTCLSPTHSTAGDEARLENDGLFIWPCLKLFSNGLSRSAISCLNRACKTPSPSSAWLNANRLLRFTARWRTAGLFLLLSPGLNLPSHGATAQTLDLGTSFQPRSNRECISEPCPSHQPATASSVDTVIASLLCSKLSHQNATHILRPTTEVFVTPNATTSRSIEHARGSNNAPVTLPSC
jgi:hypothetical protein